MLIFRGALSVILIIALYGYIMYRTILFFKECSKIEKKIEEVRDGNNQLPLDVNKFSSEFRNVATSINNISEGIETAVQERMKSERLKAELITNVSHDIKTPLTSIINYSDLLKNEKIDNEKANEYIEIIYSKSQRLKRLTEDLIEASKIQTGNDIGVFGDDVNIAIKNISKDKLNISADELTQRFVRGESSRTTEGSGLGISIAQNLTTLQDGKFDLVLDGDLFKVRMSFKII